MTVKHQQRTDADTAGRGQRSAGIKAIRTALEQDAVRSIVGIVTRVGDLVDSVAEDGGLARQTAQRKLERFHAETRPDPDAVRADERDCRNGGVADLRSQLCEVVKDGIRRRVEHLVLVEGLDTQSFVFDQESVHFDLFNRRICANRCALLLLLQQ